MHDFIVSIYSFGIRHGWKKGTLNLAHKSRWSQQCAHINHQFISIGMVSTKWIADLHIYNSGWIYLFVYTRMCVWPWPHGLCVCACVHMSRWRNPIKTHKIIDGISLFVIAISIFQKNSFVTAFHRIGLIFLWLPLSSLYSIFLSEKQ